MMNDDIIIITVHRVVYTVCSLIMIFLLQDHGTRPVWYAKVDISLCVIVYITYIRCGMLFILMSLLCYRDTLNVCLVSNLMTPSCKLIFIKTP